MTRWVGRTAPRDESKHIAELDALRRLLPSERQSMAIERG
jgi:hypothetical protein